MARIDAGDRERQGHVLVDVEQRNQVEELEDEARLLAPQAGRLRVAQAADHLAVEHDLAAGGPVEPAEQLEQRALAGAGRAHQGHELAAADLERDASQGLDLAVAEPVALGQVAGFEDRAVGSTAARPLRRAGLGLGPSGRLAGTPAV